MDFAGFPGFGAPRYTQVPDLLFDELLPELKCAELRVLLIIMRQTFGWKRDADAISLSQLTDRTGLTRPAVTSATQALEEMGCIIIERRENPDGGRATNVYRLRIRDEDTTQDSQV